MKQKVFFLVILLVVIALIIGIVRMFVGKSPKQGDLRVDSTPVASVFLDNKHIGRTPLGATSFKVDAGEYTIKIVPESATTQYASWQGKIRITPNVLTYVNGTLAESELASAIDVLWLEKTTGAKGELSVTTTPDSATVMLDGLPTDTSVPTDTFVPTDTSVPTATEYVQTQEDILYQEYQNTIEDGGTVQSFVYAPLYQQVVSDRYRRWNEAKANG